MSHISDLPSSAKRQFRETKFPSWDLHAQKLTASAVWACDAADTVAFLQAAAGKPEVVGTVLRIIPLQYPDFGGNLPLFATRIEPEGLGHNQGDFYSHARIKVSFESYPFALDGNQAYMTVSFQSGGRKLALPLSALWFPDNGNVHPLQDEGIDDNGFDFEITSYFLPSPLNLGAYNALVRKTNNATFLGMDEGKVKYNALSGNVTQNLMGQVTNTVTHSLSWSGIGWNNAALPDGSGFGRLTFTDGTPRYPEADLSPLFG